MLCWDQEGTLAYIQRLRKEVPFNSTKDTIVEETFNESPINLESVLRYELEQEIIGQGRDKKGKKDPVKEAGLRRVEDLFLKTISNHCN